MKWRFIVLLAGLVLATTAAAHKPSDAYLWLDRSDATPVLRADLALRDLEQAEGVDGNGDGRITWAELQARGDHLNAWFEAGTTVSAAGEPCGLSARELAVATHSDGPYAVLAFDVSCPGAARPDRFGYRLLFEADPLHRGLLSVIDGGTSHSLVLSPDRRSAALPADPSIWATVKDFTVEGTWHIWIGLDHLLFLTVLLLPAALAGGVGGRGVSLRLVKVVTAFTVAHSITLSLAVLGYIELPGRFVESVIAASIVIAALGNLVPGWRHMGWLLAFGFGLVHGLGFASVLADLGLPASALWPALLAFNVGVEIGQLAVVAAVLPVLLALRQRDGLRRVALPTGSLAAAVIGGIWLVERLA